MAKQQFYHRQQSNISFWIDARTDTLSHRPGSHVLCRCYSRNSNKKLGCTGRHGMPYLVCILDVICRSMLYFCGSTCLQHKVATVFKGCAIFWETEEWKPKMDSRSVVWNTKEVHFLFFSCLKYLSEPTWQTELSIFYLYHTLLTKIVYHLIIAQ